MAPKAASAAFATAHQFASAEGAGGKARPASAAKKPATSERTAAAKAATRPAASEKTPAPEKTKVEPAAAAAAAARPAPESPANVSGADPAAPGPAAAAPAERPGAAQKESPREPALGHPAHESSDPGGGDRHDDLHQEHERMSFAAMALTALVGALAVAALTLWLAPKIAPHMPAGIAGYLAPGQAGVEERLAELEARIGEERILFEESRAAFDTERGSLTTEIQRLQEQVATLAAEGPAADTGAGLEAAAGEREALSGRVDELVTGLDNMRAEIAAMNKALAEAEGGEGPTEQELATAFAQLQSRVESLASDLQTARAGIDEQIAGLAGRVDEALGRADAAETARAEAEAEAERAAAGAALKEALVALQDNFASGAPYAEPLGETERLSGTEAPEALATPAEAGLATSEALADELSRVAHDAIAAAAREDAPDDLLGGVMGWARAQVTGRPTEETEGDSAGAILSRVEARLEEGDAPAALAEAETLPEAARSALGDWLERLRARAAAERALADWRAGLSAAG